MTDQEKTYKTATFTFRLEKEFLLTHDTINESSPMSESRHLAEIAQAVERRRQSTSDYNIDEDAELGQSGLLSRLSVKLKTDPEYFPNVDTPAIMEDWSADEDSVDEDSDEEDSDEEDSDEEDLYFNELRSFFEEDYCLEFSANQPRDEFIGARVTNISFDRESRMSDHAVVFIEMEATFELSVWSAVGKDDLTWCEYLFDFEVDGLNYDDNWDTEGEGYWPASECEWGFK